MNQWKCTCGQINDLPGYQFCKKCGNHIDTHDSNEKIMIWKKLHFAMDHPPHVKEGDFTGTYISEDGQYMIEPAGENGMHNLRGRTQEALQKTNHKVITGHLDDLKGVDLTKIFL